MEKIPILRFKIKTVIPPKLVNHHGEDIGPTIYKGKEAFVLTTHYDNQGLVGKTVHRYFYKINVPSPYWSYEERMPLSVFIERYKMMFIP